MDAVAGQEYFDAVLNIPAEPFQLGGLSHTHDMIINWLIANPEKKNRECAEYFHYSESWLSTLIHTNLFQARLKARQDEVFSLVAADVPEKLAGLADLASVKLGEALEKSENPDFILDSFDKILHRAGYAPASQKNPAGVQNIQNNTFLVGKEVLQAAREVMNGVSAPVETPAPQISAPVTVEHVA